MVVSHHVVAGNWTFLTSEPLLQPLKVSLKYKLNVLSILKGKKMKAIRNKFQNCMSRVCVHFHAFVESENDQSGAVTQFVSQRIIKYKKVWKGFKCFLTWDEMLWTALKTYYSTIHVNTKFVSSHLHCGWVLLGIFLTLVHFALFHLYFRHQHL